jgi:hypothetical protein
MVESRVGLDPEPALPCASFRGAPVSLRTMRLRGDRTKKLLDTAALVLAGLASLATSETIPERSTSFQGDDVRVEGVPRTITFRVHFEPFLPELQDEYRGEVFVHASTSTAPGARVSLSRADGLLGATAGLVSPGQVPLELRDGDVMRRCVLSQCTVEYSLQFAPTSSSTTAASVAWEVTAVVINPEERLDAPHAAIELLP